VGGESSQICVYRLLLACARRRSRAKCKPSLRSRAVAWRWRSRARRHVRWIQLASDGTPEVFSTNSMYQPGGAIVLADGNSKVNSSGPLWVYGRSTSRCSPSVECVVAPGRIRQAEVIRPASGTAAARVPP